MDLIRRRGERRVSALDEADAALSEAFDEIERAYRAQERVNIKEVARLLGLTRQTVYAELERRGVR